MRLSGRKILGVVLVGVMLWVPACGDSEPAEQKGGGKGDGKMVVPEGLFLTVAPDGIQKIPDLKASAKEGDEVVIHGVIGGRKEPFGGGRAYFNVVDASHERICGKPDGPGSACPNPWDFCCTAQDKLTGLMATVQLVGEDGKPLTGTLQGVHGLKPLTKLIIKGKVAIVGEKVLTVNATGLFLDGEG